MKESCFIDDQTIKDFTSNLKTLRRTVGWTQEELAKKVGVTRQTITAIENGSNLPSATLVAALAGVFFATATFMPVLSAVVGVTGIGNVFKKIFGNDIKKY